MRLLLASYYYRPSVGGLERQTHLLARGLVERGHQVQVLAARLPGFSARETLDGVAVERIRPGSGSRWTRMATYVAGMWRVALRERARTDVIQVQQALYPAAAMAVLARAMARPLVVRNSGSGDFGAVREMSSLVGGGTALRLIGQLATNVALSSEMADEMRTAGFRRVVLIPNAVRLPAQTTAASRLEARAALGLDGWVVLYCGRLAAEKGLDTLISAWQAVGRSATGTLVIVGDGPAYERLQRQAASDSATADNIRFSGHVEDVQRYLRAADVFVLPSKSEGMSNALLEAMAAGLPVIASDTGGNREVIDRPDIGTLVAVGDVQVLADAIRSVFANPARAARSGAAAREHVAQRYSPDAMITAYERLYEHVTSR